MSTNSDRERDYTTISVNIETRNRLFQRKCSPTESYDDVIERLIAQQERDEQ